MARGLAHGDRGLLERDAALDSMRHWRTRAHDGAGVVGLVTGDAGIGKTTLLREFANSVPSGVLVLDSACDPLTTPGPLAPLREVVSILGMHPGHVDDATDRSELFQSVLDRLVEVGPAVWTIEDLHWADTSTLDLIRFIARRIERTSTLMMLTFRSDEIDARHPFQPVLGELARSSHVERVELLPLTLDAVRVLAGDRPAERIHEITGGNPFFVTEILAGDARPDDPTPDTVRDAVLGRIGRLSERARAVVHAVSIAPRSISYTAVQSLTDASDELMAEVLGSGVVRGDDDGMFFRHELARRAVEMSIPVPRRRSLHCSLLQQLVEEDASEPSLLAHHAARSGDGPSIAEWCPPAVRRAVDVLSLREAVVLTDIALRHRRHLDTDVLVEMLATHIEALIGLDRYADAREASDDLLAVASESGDLAHEARAHLARARQRYWSGDRIAAVDDADAAIVAAERSGHEQLIAQALLQRAHMEMLKRHGRSALEMAERAMKLIGDADSELRSTALTTTGCACVVVGELDRGFELLREAYDTARRHDDRGRMSSAMANLGSGAGEMKRYGDAEVWLGRALALAIARDDDSSARYGSAWLARVRFERGEWSAAEKLADSFVGDPTSITMLTAGGTRGRLGVRRGVATARDDLEVLLESCADDELQHRWPALCGLAELAWLEGRPEDGVEVLAEPYREALTTDSIWAKGELGFWLWRCGGDVEPSIHAASDTPFDSHIIGDWRAAAERWSDIGCPYEHALALGDGTTETRLEALRILDRLGAKPLASRVRQRLRDDGVESIPRAPRASTREHPAGLTVRQVEVVSLARDGLTNREIADRLFVSPKTVEHHMSAILAKLGVGNRREAVEAADTWASGR